MLKESETIGTPSTPDLSTVSALARNLTHPILVLAAQSSNVNPTILTLYLQGQFRVPCKILHVQRPHYRPLTNHQIYVSRWVSRISRRHAAGRVNLRRCATHSKMIASSAQLSRVMLDVSMRCECVRVCVGRGPECNYVINALVLCSEANNQRTTGVWWSGAFHCLGTIGDQ